jgi:LysR family hydrogen peroxide-inducible transcriptional activator
VSDHPIPFTLRQLQYLLAIAETHSFRRAAAKCAVSQPSLSLQVAALEKALGVRFFERDRRGVLPTLAGEALLERVRRVLLEVDELTEAARMCQDPLVGILRLGVIPTMAPYLLPRAMPFLQEAFPRLTLRWIEERTSSLVAQLQGGRLDGALLAQEADLGNLETVVLGKDPFHLALPKGHPLARDRAPVRLDALEGERLLLLDEGHCLRDQTLVACREARVEELSFRATSLSTLVQMVASGLGITLLPRMAADLEAGRSSLAIRPLAEPTPFRTLVLAWRRGSHAGPALREMALLLKERLVSEP